jgi:hypothetical protein
LLGTGDADSRSVGSDQANVKTPTGLCSERDVDPAAEPTVKIEDGRAGGIAILGEAEPTTVWKAYLLMGAPLIRRVQDRVLPDSA